jgi:hypothetical protein
VNIAILWQKFGAKWGKSIGSINNSKPFRGKGSGDIEYRRGQRSRGVKKGIVHEVRGRLSRFRCLRVWRLKSRGLVGIHE